MSNPPTNPTSLSLIKRARTLDKTAWERLSKLYTPLVWQWARNAKLQENDAADVVQDVFQAVAKSINKFDHGEGLPPFRAWLWGIARHKIMDHFRRVSKQPHGDGGTSAQIRMSHLPEQEIIEERTDPSCLADKNSLAFRAIQLMKLDFAENTWQAFWRVTIEDQSPADVANDLGISIGSVYTAKSRVLSRLRSELEGLT